MAFSDRARRKSVKAAAELLDPGTTIREVGVGRAQFRWTTATIVAMSIFGAAFVIALLLGIVLVPGGILLFVALNSSWPMRTVVVADQGVALLQRSPWTGRPNKVLALLPHHVLAVALPSDIRRREFGTDVVRFSDRQLKRLTAALPDPVAVAVG